MWENGNRFIGYTGDRNDVGERNGQGTEFYSDGSLYIGTWKSDLKDGVGKVIYSNGQVFEGSFVDGERNGEATIIWPDGKSFSGTYKNDKGDGTITNGTTKRKIYEGEVNATGQMHGRYQYF